MLVQIRTSFGSEKGIREKGPGVSEKDGLSDQVAVEHLFGLLLEEGDQVVTVLGLLETTKGHLGAGNVLLGVLEVIELCCISLSCSVRFAFPWRERTREPSSQVTPFCLLASVYEKPST
jgi:hypothetical protein